MLEVNRKLEEKKYHKQYQKDENMYTDERETIITVPELKELLRLRDKIFKGKDFLYFTPKQRGTPDFRKYQHLLERGKIMVKVLTNVQKAVQSTKK